MAKRNNFDPSLDRVFGTFEIVLDKAGKVVAHGRTVDQPEDKEAVRYRFSVAAYNGGPMKLRRQTVRTIKSGEERVAGAQSVPVEHVAALSQAAVKLHGAIMAKMAARKAG